MVRFCLGFGCETVRKMVVVSLATLSTFVRLALHFSYVTLPLILLLLSHGSVSGISGLDPSWLADPTNTIFCSYYRYRRNLFIDLSTCLSQTAIHTRCASSVSST